MHVLSFTFFKRFQIKLKILEEWKDKIEKHLKLNKSIENNECYAQLKSKEDIQQLLKSGLSDKCLKCFSKSIGSVEKEANLHEGTVTHFQLYRSLILNSVHVL